MKVKRLNWREIDPGRRYVGTGLGFTCEVRLLHSGMWEVALPAGNTTTLTCSGGFIAAQKAYDAIILSCLEEEPQP